MSSPPLLVDGPDEIRFDGEALGFDQEAMMELLEDMPLALAITLGPEHRYSFANRLFRQTLDPLLGPPAGRPLPELLGELFTEEIRALLGKVLETGEPFEAMGVPLAVVPDRETTYWDIKLRPVRGTDRLIRGTMILAIDAAERVKARAEADRHSREAAIDHARLALAVDATELGFWEWDVHSGEIYWSDQQKKIFGRPLDETICYNTWSSALHPDDHDRIIREVSVLLNPSSGPNSGGRLQFEHRLVRPDGQIRWISARGRMLYENENGETKPVRLLGTVLDITDRRKNEEARQLLVRELHHRVKNLFAIASGMVSLSARTTGSPKDMAAVIQGRLNALARAHELIHPAVTGHDLDDREITIEDIVRTVLAPHIDQAFSTRVAFEGESVSVGTKTTTALSLVLHELATNTSKYGALSVPDGTIRIVCRPAPPVLVLFWQESNGPAIECNPRSEGFGSQLIRRSVADQLGGDITYEWRPEGLHVQIRLPLDCLSL